MKRTITLLATLGLLFSLNSCTVMKVSERNESGYFNSVKQAKTIKSEKVDLDNLKSLLLVPKSKDNFVEGMIKNINYFEQIMTFDDLEKEIIKNNKQDEVGNFEGRIGLHNASKKYRKFLYISIYQPNDKKIQLKLINPETTDEIFIAETNFDLVWSGVNDSNTFNPLFNELIKYIQSNSKTYTTKK